jgi:hypothetical protein
VIYALLISAQIPVAGIRRTLPYRPLNPLTVLILKPPASRIARDSHPICGC